MSLLKKTLLVVASTVVISTLTIFLTSRSTLLQGYEKIEIEDAKANLLRTVNGYHDQSKGIVISARAYAVWDDMYNFVQSPKQEFIAHLGLTPDLYATHQANLIAILDVNYQPLFLQMYDLDTLQPLNIPTDLSVYLQPGSLLLQHSAAAPEISGVILLDGKPMYVASLASLHTNFSGEPRGAVIFGRYLDDKVVAKLSRTVQIPLSTFLPNDEAFPPKVKNALDGLGSEEQPTLVETLDNHTIAGYAIIKTIEGRPAFVLKIELPRQIYAKGMTSFYYFTVLTAIAGFVFVIISTLLLRRFVLFPLTDMIKQVNEIRASGNNSKRLSIRGDDELAYLGHTINEMLTVLEQHNQEIELANKELGAFSYSVSHDLRAPLRAIDGYIRIVVEDYGTQLDQEGRNYLLKARENVKRMNRLIDDLLAFSRLGRQALNKSIVQPEKIVRQVLDDLRPEYAQRQVEFSVAELPACEADPAMLHQVFMNLIGNAIKYTSRREQAKIEIGWQAKDGQTVYFVRDNGAGFDMQFADKLFGVFQRLHHTAEFDGTGVGLAITQRIIDRHGGKIWAEAEVEQGATFYFTI